MSRGSKFEQLPGERKAGPGARSKPTERDGERVRCKIRRRWKPRREERGRRRRRRRRRRRMMRDKEWEEMERSAAGEKLCRRRRGIGGG